MAIEALNRSLALALMAGGTTVPITHWMDEWGEDCEVEDAVFAVAGPSPDGRWYTLELAEFETPETH